MDRNKLGPYFRRINVNNLYKIFFYLDPFTIAQCAFLNQQFKQLLYKKMPRRINMVVISLKTYNKELSIKFPSDFKFYLSQNSYLISKEIKRQIVKEINDSNINYVKIHILEYFFTNLQISNFLQYDLSNCNIGRKSIKYLSYFLSKYNTPIDKVDLSENKLTSNVLEPLINTYPRNTNTLIKHLKTNKSLLDGNSIKYLSKINIYKLTMIQCNIDKHMISLLKSDSIEVLDLSNNSLSSNGVLYICQNIPNLTYLNLTKNSLNDIAIFYLCLYLKQKQCKLSTLILAENEVSSKGFLCLLSLISKKQMVFKKLNMMNNIISNIPRKEIMNYKNANIENIKIGENNLTNEDCQVIFEYIMNNKYIRYVDLSGLILNNVSIRFMYNQLNEHQDVNIKKIKMNFCYLDHTNINDNLFSYFSNNEIQNKITAFSLAHNNIQLVHFNKVFQLDLIEYLNLEGNDLNLNETEILNFFDIILTSQTIKTLNLNNNFLSKLANHFLMKLSEQTCQSSLETLYLKDNKISNLNIELTNLLINNKTLKSLYLDNNDISNEIENGYFFHSAECSSIQLLSLKENKLGLSFIEKINKFINDKQNNSKVEQRNRWKIRIDIRSKGLTESYLKEKGTNNFKEKSIPESIICI